MMLKDKVVLITGAGGGIGRAVAMAAAAQGARLAVADLDLAGARRTADLVTQAGGQALALSADVGEAAQVDAMVTATVERYGRLDGAFNNAGINQQHVGAPGKRLGDIDEDAFAALMRTNVTGTWLCMRAELRHMSAHGGGAIVNTSSIVGLKGRAGSGAYSASKHAINGLTQSAALEYAVAGIRVNAVCPGLIRTEFLQSAITARGEEAMTSTVPMRRLGEPDDVAEMVVWLLSDHARYVTGGLHGVDGGFMAA